MLCSLLRTAPKAAHEQNKDRADGGSRELDVMEALGPEPGFEMSMDDRIGHDDLAADPSEQRRAGPNQDRIAVQQGHDQSRPGHDQGNADREANHEERNIALRR